MCKVAQTFHMSISNTSLNRYDMYVGQGEKNVKAVFSLARKLSPCVVFIDEVDSLMNKRGSDYSSKSHREIINQFMVEWDGLSSNNQGVIVMAATNRPFDLDDAVLRRMPRRILGIFIYIYIYSLFTYNKCSRLA